MTKKPEDRRSIENIIGEIEATKNKKRGKGDRGEEKRGRV